MKRTSVRRRLGHRVHDGTTCLVGLAGVPTYRRLSKTYRLPDGAKRVYCHHIRKTAGTSLHFSFLALGDEDPAAVHRRIAASAAAPDHQRAAMPSPPITDRCSSRGPISTAGRTCPRIGSRCLPRTFTVTILRDPCDRVVSHYNYIREGDQPGMAFAVTDAERALAGNGFPAFLAALPKKDLLRQIFTFSPSFSVAEAAERISACSAVLFTETYESGLAALATRLDLPLELQARSRHRVPSPDLECGPRPAAGDPRARIRLAPTARRHADRGREPALSTTGAIAAPIAR